MTVESCDLKFTCPDSSGSNCLQVLKKLVPQTDCEKMIHAFISNGSDCCNAPFAGLSQSSEFLHIGKYNHYPSVYVTSLAPRTHTHRFALKILLLVLEARSGLALWYKLI